MMIIMFVCISLVCMVFFENPGRLEGYVLTFISLDKHLIAYFMEGIPGQKKSQMLSIYYQVECGKYECKH